MSDQTAQKALIEAFKEFCGRYVGMLENARDRIVSFGGDCDSVDVMERRDPYLRKAREAIAAAERANGDLQLWYADTEAGVTMVRAFTKEEAIQRSGLFAEQLRPFNCPGVVAFTWRRPVTERIGATIEQPRDGESMAAYALRQRQAIRASDNRLSIDVYSLNGSEPLS